MSPIQAELAENTKTIREGLTKAQMLRYYSEALGSSVNNRMRRSRKGYLAACIAEGVQFHGWPMPAKVVR